MQRRTETYECSVKQRRSATCVCTSMFASAEAPYWTCLRCAIGASSPSPPACVRPVAASAPTRLAAERAACAEGRRGLSVVSAALPSCTCWLAPECPGDHASCAALTEPGLAPADPSRCVGQASVASGCGAECAAALPGACAAHALVIRTPHCIDGWRRVHRCLPAATYSWRARAVERRIQSGCALGVAGSIGLAYVLSECHVMPLDKC